MNETKYDKGHAKLRKSQRWSRPLGMSTSAEVDSVPGFSLVNATYSKGMTYLNFRHTRPPSPAFPSRAPLLHTRTAPVQTGMPTKKKCCTKKNRERLQCLFQGSRDNMSTVLVTFAGLKKSESGQGVQGRRAQRAADQVGQSFAHESVLGWCVSFS